MCVETDSHTFVDYQQREKALEIRKTPFQKGKPSILSGSSVLVSTDRTSPNKIQVM